MATSIAQSSAILVAPFVVLLAYSIVRVFYNIFLHPLRSYPGPLSARATFLTYQRQLLRGTSQHWLKDLHENYGSVVRCSPNELSFIDPQVWKDVYGHKSPFQKDLKHFYGPDMVGSPPGLVRADDVSHARQRKLVSNAFSDKALRDQEKLLKTHVALLIEKLKELSLEGEGRAINLVEWYNFTTFDIMSDLAFGKSLGQLTSSSYSPWVKAVFSSIGMVAVTRVCREWPGVMTILNMLVPTEMKKRRATHLAFVKNSIDERMARKTDRPDIWSLVTKSTKEGGMALAPTELYSNGSLFMMAGTETTATELSGLTYLLLNNPEKLARLTEEIRTTFATFEDLDVTKLSQLKYLGACLEEGLRLYPPVPIGLVRITPGRGVRVCGHWVPGGTAVQCPIYTASRSPRNFNNPEKFAPERFLPEGADEYATDHKDALNAFSYGPRNCLGKNLAYHEMRLILASILLHFDLDLDLKTGDWLNQKVFIVWDKHPLFVKLKPVQG